MEKGFNLVKITERVMELKKTLSNSIIELGKQLTMVRKNLPRGEWMDWLKYEVKIPYIQAWRFIKISKEVDLVTLEKIGYRKLVDILELPPSTFRDELIELAPSLRGDDIKEIKNNEKERRNKHKEFEESENIEININMEYVDTVLEANAVLLDALSKIQVPMIRVEYFDLILSQFKETVLTVSVFLRDVESGKRD